MSCSIIAGCVVSLTVRQMAPAALLRCLVYGYEPPAGMEMLAGGGLLSMVQVAGIVLLTSAYAGLLEATGLLDGLSALGRCLAPAAGGLSDHGAGGPACGRCKLQPDAWHHADQPAVRASWRDRKKMVLPLENGIVLLAAVIPWSIAGSVPCAIMGVGPECLPYAFYLYVVPLTDMLRRH